MGEGEAVFDVVTMEFERAWGEMGWELSAE
jgi:hypothetical protein